MANDPVNSLIAPVNHNPDVLSCLANLSNDEVFTPPSVANAMLDLLPQELFQSPETKFLDPVCKSGVFLREITKRLMAGLENEFPDPQKRLDHILHNQVYGIAITELTSLLSRRTLYCAKYATSPYAISKFPNIDGNIRFKAIQHTWKNGKCVFCGAAQSQYEREDVLETHAYEFIHTDNPQEIFGDMKFDVIIGNPPYQLNDGGHGMSAKPIYHHFVNQAKNLNPYYISMIIPARWYAGGKGLEEFRSIMLNDKRLKNITDYENSSEVFSGVDIAGGICYFLWDKSYNGLCEVSNILSGNKTKSFRKLNKFTTFIRQYKSENIIDKVLKLSSKFLESRVSSRKPFSLPTNYKPAQAGIPCWFIQKIGLQYANKSDVTDDSNILNKWKLLIPPAPIAGQTDFSKPIALYYESNVRIAKPGECCTESWIVAGAFLTEKETLAFKSYLMTKIVRFLILQTVVSQHVTKKNFCFVPDLENYDAIYTDAILCKKWNITEEEWEFINSKII